MIALALLIVAQGNYVKDYDATIKTWISMLGNTKPDLEKKLGAPVAVATAMWQYDKSIPLVVTNGFGEKGYDSVSLPGGNFFFNFPIKGTNPLIGDTKDAGDVGTTIKASGVQIEDLDISESHYFRTKKNKTEKDLREPHQYENFVKRIFGKPIEGQWYVLESSINGYPRYYQPGLEDMAKNEVRWPLDCVRVGLVDKVPVALYTRFWAIKVKTTKGYNSQTGNPEYVPGFEIPPLDFLNFSHCREMFVGDISGLITGRVLGNPKLVPIQVAYDFYGMAMKDSKVQYDKKNSVTLFSALQTGSK